MQIITPCIKCGQPITIHLPDETTDAEAQSVARLIVCEPCGSAAMLAQYGQSQPEAQNKNGDPLFR